MNDTTKTVGDLERDAAAEREWLDYNEHLNLGGKKLHFRSIFGLGWDARDKLLLKLHGEGAMADVIRLQQEVSSLKWQLAGADLEIKRLSYELTAYIRPGGQYAAHKALHDENRRLKAEAEEYHQEAIAWSDENAKLREAMKKSIARSDDYGDSCCSHCSQPIREALKTGAK